jgi:hypothetical protein
MRERIVGWMVVAAVVLLGAAAPARAEGVDEAGTVGLSGFGDYGYMTGNSRYGLDFTSGGGYGVTLRYVVDPHWSLGLYFQNQTYDARTTAVSGPPDEEAPVDKLVVTDVMADVYFYRDRTIDASQYLVAGLGFYRPEIRSSGGTVLFPGENLVLSAGAGVEVFIRENWGLDLNGRGFAYFGDGLSDQELDNPDVKGTGSLAAGFHVQVGIFYYLLR